MSVVKNYVRIRLQLIQIDVLEVAILLVTYLVYYVFQSKQKILHVFNMITGINKSEILAKHIWCKCKSKVDSKKCNSNQKRNNDKCQFECKNPKEQLACENNFIWNPATCCGNGKCRKYYWRLVITRGATIEQTKTILTTTKTVLAKTNSNKKYFNKNYTNKNYFKKKKPVKRNLL